MDTMTLHQRDLCAHPTATLSIHGGDGYRWVECADCGTTFMPVPLPEPGRPPTC